ncbi:MAG: HAD family hydrolase [Pseudomonadota bacterium]|nr:HAD family hydrolase [Pseudomonadota bacterium]MEE3101027.1 HAD family hydrolase [Pseudomonadota bacterium]
MFVAAAAAVLPAAATLADPLPSWNDDGAQARIEAFVAAVTDPASPDYVTPARRIAVFDNDGTLWSEQPVYFQLAYALDRLRGKAEADPSILTSDALKAGAAGDVGTLAATGAEGLMEVIGATHSGMTAEAFMADVADWMATATHPVAGLRYADMTYQPMVELLTYLRDNGFATWIVSGGGVHFIRAFAEAAYGIPPWQVVGSRGETAYDADAHAVLKKGGLTLNDDKAGKPVGIDQQIGARPIFAAGNSDGDFEMLDYVTAGEGPSLGLIVHHTDAEREFAYDREGHIGVLNRGLDEAGDRGWLLVDMKTDWTRIWTGGE